MRSRWLVLLGLIFATLLIGYLQNQDFGQDPGLLPSTSPTQTQSTPTVSGNVISEADLPQEARETLQLIDDGGPYPYRQDDGVFGNRERLLPAQPRGYYREYTVETQGEDDRGARRLVVGSKGEAYYTGDHYASFKQVERSR